MTNAETNRPTWRKVPLIVLFAAVGVLLWEEGAPPFAQEMEPVPQARVSPVGSTQVVLPQFDGAVHLGVRSCSASQCHGQRGPTGPVVLQNEYGTWSDRDLHAHAYQALLTEDSKTIARNLGLEQPAHEAQLCLNCHTDFVPTELRGEYFRLDRGIGCEGCHGGAGQRPGDAGWLRDHTDRNHAENVADGMYPTDDPAARASLCLSCHFGNSDRYLTHGLMGAGHPRASFELATFTALQPAHFRADADYVERGKVPANYARTWAAGQAIQVRELLDALSDPKRYPRGAWPEFVYFDCHACHHPMKARQWAPQLSTGLGFRPGLPRLNDSNLLMLERIGALIDGDVSGQVRRQTRNLHAAMSLGRGDIDVPIAGLRAVIDRLLPLLQEWELEPAQVRELILQLTDEGSQGKYRDWAAAEQAAMATQALLLELNSAGALEREERQAVGQALRSLLAEFEDDVAYRPERLKAPFRQLHQILAN